MDGYPAGTASGCKALSLTDVMGGNCSFRPMVDFMAPRR